MADRTQHYDLSAMGAGDVFSADSYKHLNADRKLIDQLLFLGAEAHKHIGTGVTGSNPETAPTLTLDTTQGAIPSATRVYYKFSLVDGNGIETLPSPVSWIDTPPPVGSPGAATLNNSTTGGILPAGNYYYQLSAYTDFSSRETLAGSAAYIAVPFTTSTNRITLTLPQLPPGADGFNIYRRKPNGTGFFYLDSVDMTVATPPTTYVDTGTNPYEDCNRYLPTANTTVSNNAVTVYYPGATPALPVGYSWRIYRTDIAGNFTNSLLVTLDTALSYLDLGAATSVGEPTSSGLSITSPTQIQLTDASEVQGRLPMSKVSAYPHCETFVFGGQLTEPKTGTIIWVCPFPRATIVSVQASLGIGSTPAGQDVIADVNIFHPGATPVWETIFTTQANRPKVLVGAQIGDPALPDISEIVAGEAIACDLDQIGSGATPTDANLTITVLMYVYGWTSLISHPWAV